MGTRELTKICPFEFDGDVPLKIKFLPLNSSNKVAPGVNLNPMLIMGVTALAFAKHIPVISPVTRNMVRSVKDICSKAIDSTTSFFSSVKPIQPSKEERLEEQQPIFKTGCN